MEMIKIEVQLKRIYHMILRYQEWINGSVKSDIEYYPLFPGPMLLFERFFKDGKSAKFFACSACRDKKHCSFFQWEHEKISPARKHAHDEIIKRSKPLPQQLHYSKELEQILKSRTKNDLMWTFCHDCNVLVWDDKDKHKSHSIQSSEDVNELCHPSMILKPLDNVKAQAVSSRTVNIVSLQPLLIKILIIKQYMQ